MQRCLSVAFEFKGREYYAIVRHRVMKTKSYFKVRIMNHRLDSMLNRGNGNIIEEQDWEIALTASSESGEEAVLRSCIANQLVRQLQLDHNKNQSTTIKDFSLLTPY